MATYAIGDIQGCYQSFKKLLKKIRFNDKRDQLWLAGDMINRGPESLKVMQWILRHKANVTAVLGNHDLHFLAVALDIRNASKSDTFSDILTTPDKAAIIDWLLQCPLAHYDKKLNALMIHAGLYPKWTRKKVIKYSQEISDLLQSKKRDVFLKQMYGNSPEKWHNTLEGMKRFRFITNACTRMRLVNEEYCLDLKHKGPIDEFMLDLKPWFLRMKKHPKCDLYFGHWAALNGECGIPNMWALDTGCVWGKTLTAIRLEDTVRFQVNAQEKQLGQI